MFHNKKDGQWLSLFRKLLITEALKTTNCMILSHVTNFSLCMFVPHHNPWNHHLSSCLQESKLLNYKFFIYLLSLLQSNLYLVFETYYINKWSCFFMLISVCFWIKTVGWNNWFCSADQGMKHFWPSSFHVFRLETKSVFLRFFMLPSGLLVKSLFHACIPSCLWPLVCGC